MGSIFFYTDDILDPLWEFCGCLLVRCRVHWTVSELTLIFTFSSDFWLSQWRPLFEWYEVDRMDCAVRSRHCPRSSCTIFWPFSKRGHHLNHDEFWLGRRCFDIWKKQFFCKFLLFIIYNRKHSFYWKMNKTTRCWTRSCVLKKWGSYRFPEGSYGENTGRVIYYGTPDSKMSTNSNETNFTENLFSLCYVKYDQIA